MSTFYQLPESGAEVILIVHMVVREDAQLLYGFASSRERELFRALLKVNGVGAKLALTLLSGISPDDLVRCVQHDDTATLVRLPGVGKKTAERLVVELRDRLDGIAGFSGTLPTSATGGFSVSAPDAPVDAMGEAQAALVSLGYKPAEASRLLSKIDGSEEMNSEQLIRAALKQAVR